MEILLVLALFIVALYISRRVIRAFLKEGQQRHQPPPFPRTNLQPDALQPTYCEALQPDALQRSSSKAEHYERQLAAVTRPEVKFWKKQIISRDEFDLFCAAMTVTEQRLPRAFYVFPQVSLGEVIGCDARDVYDAFNCKRCGLLLTDGDRRPIAALEYQGSGHGIDGDAGARDDIKQIALRRAKVRYVEIFDGTAQDEMQRIIRGLLPVAGPAA
jgi:hypothetical protein